MLGVLLGSSEWGDFAPAHLEDRTDFQEGAAGLWHSHRAAWESKVCQVILRGAGSVSPGRANGEDWSDADAHTKAQAAGAPPLHARVSVASHPALPP